MNSRIFVSNFATEIKKLRQAINGHNHLYYALHQTEISDAAYDEMLKRLETLEKEHPEFASIDSPTQRVGGGPQQEFKTVVHEIPMLSINNTYSHKELEEFDKRVRKKLGNEPFEYVLELKIDGVSLSLMYEKGELVHAATRGDGRLADDVTANVKTISTIPLNLKTEKAGQRLEVRGEVYMTHKNFMKLNRDRQKAGQELFANPRNATSGSLKLLDPSLVADRPLCFAAHSLGIYEKGAFERHWDVLHFFETAGLPVIGSHQLCQNLKQVFQACDYWEVARKKLDFDTDGLVLNCLLYTSPSPRD